MQISKQILFWGIINKHIIFTVVDNKITLTLCFAENSIIRFIN